MWLIRAIVPIAAMANIITFMLAHHFFANANDEVQDVVIVPAAVLYLLCTSITVKDGLGLAIATGIAASIYFALAKHFPLYDFNWSGYAYTVALIVALAVFSSISNTNDEKKVRRYFLLRQIGSVEDVIRYTDISASGVQRAIEDFIKSGELVLMLEKPAIYKWTAERNYPEGMQTRVLEIDF